MQDNDRLHVTGVCQQFLHDEGSDAMDWPGVTGPESNRVHLEHHASFPASSLPCFIIIIMFYHHYAKCAEEVTL